MMEVEVARDPVGLMSSSIARTAPALIKAAGRSAGGSRSPAAHTSCPFAVIPSPERATAVSEPIVFAQAVHAALLLPRQAGRENRGALLVGAGVRTCQARPRC